MRSFKIFLKTVAATTGCLILICGIYLGFCGVYESMRSTLFDDDRSAVIIGENYFKFFDKEFFFG